MFRTLSMSRSHGLLPDFFDSSPASFLSSIPSIDDMEERQREREKQKLLNMSIDYSSYSPISSFDKPTNFSRPNQNSAFDGLYVPYGGSNVWDDPWAIKKEKQEINELPPMQPELIKQPSQPINPFATDVAPSLVFPYDVQQVSPASILSDQPSPTPSLMMSDSSEEDDMMIQAHKRQRGEHHTIYVQQQPQDQDMISTMDVTPYTQPSLLTQPSQTGFVDFTANVNPQHITINNHYTVNNNNNNNINDSFLFTPCPMPVPFTLQPQAVTLPHLAPISIPESTLAPSPSSSSSRRSSMYDSDGEEDVKRKRKAPSTKRNKSLPVATHVIENTGAPVKMAKFLQVDGLTTRVWIEHAIFTDNGITTDIRMIMYQGLFNGVVVHAGDVGERIVCNRRSNISREFGQYTSPVEKILVRVPSEHRPLGQTGNVLTAHGLIRFLQSKKMRKNEHQVYRRWLLHHVYSIMQQRPFTFPEGHALETKTVPDTPFTEDQFSH